MTSAHAKNRADMKQLYEDKLNRFTDAEIISIIKTTNITQFQITYLNPHSALNIYSVSDKSIKL